MLNNTTEETPMVHLSLKEIMKTSGEALAALERREKFGEDRRVPIGR